MYLNLPLPCAIDAYLESPLRHFGPFSRVVFFVVLLPLEKIKFLGSLGLLNFYFEGKSISSAQVALRSLLGLFLDLKFFCQVQLQVR